MKYLNNREEFLKRSIKKIDEYKSLENNEFYKINESENSGPFANDIPWGDSLLGRLINSTIRKAKIGANLVRIQGVIKRLKYAFDDLLGDSVKAQLSDDDQKELNKIIAFSFIDNLEKAVESGARVGDIKNLTKTAISDIKSYKDIENKDSLISQLEEFLKFLEQFKDDEGGKSEADTDESKEGEGKEGEGKEGSESGKKTSESLYPVMVKNLKSLGLILSNYTSVKVATAETSNKTKYSHRTYTTKQGDTVDKIVADTKINLKKFTADILRQKNQKILSPYPKNDQPLKAGLLLVMEKNMIFEAVPGTSNQPGGSQDRGNIKKGEDHLTQAFTKLKKDIEVLISAKEKGVGVDANFIKEITSKAVDTNTKNQIKALYVEINRYLVGDKKATIQEKDPLYKESLEVISDKNKRIIVAEKMARFTKRALQFDKEGLYGGLGDLTKPLQDYVESIKQIMQMVPSEPKKEEPKKESFLVRYDRFVRINEAEEGESSEGQSEGEKEGVGAPEVSSTSQKIIDYWKKKIDIKAFVVEKTEVIKMKEKVEELAEKNKKSIVINGMDPILDIVKCFNRAYKIHTTQVIPSGRSGGRVSNKTFMEYTCFGSGDPSNAGSGGGPYRNNAIFNQWENAVQDIMKDTKYQKIFRDETTLKTTEGNIIEKAGSNLRKFMSDMLDGDQLYKSGKDGQGLQAEFLDKYFGYKSDAKGRNFNGEEEEKENTQNANSIKTINLQFTKDPIKYESYENLAKSFFASTTQDGKVVYFFIQEVVGDTAYIVYSRTFNFFEKYISQSGISNKLTKGDLPRLNLEKAGDSGDYQIRATKKKIDDLIGKDGVFKLKGNYEIKYLTKYEAKANNPNKKSELATEPEKLNFVDSYTLYKNVKGEDDNTKKVRFILDKKIADRVSTIGGFVKVSSSDNISKTEFKKQ